MCDLRKMWIGGLCERPADFGAGESAPGCASGARPSGLNFRGDSERCRVFGWPGHRWTGKAQRRFDRPSSLGCEESRERDLRRAQVKSEMTRRVADGVATLSVLGS